MKAVIFDFNRTLYDPDLQQLFPAALPLLEYCKQRGLRMALLTKAEEGNARQTLIAELGITLFFDRIKIVSQKEEALFKDLLADWGITASQCWVVSDRLRTDLRIAKRIDCRTIWVRQGKFVAEGPETAQDEPEITVTALQEVRNFI